MGVWHRSSEECAEIKSGGVSAAALKLDPSKKYRFGSFPQEVKGRLKSVWNRTNRTRFDVKENVDISMGTQQNVQIVKDFFAAMSTYNEQELLALAAEDIEWVVPGEGWPLAGTYRGHAELAAVLKKASKEVEMKYPKPPEFVAQGDRVLVIGVATGKIYATDKPYKDEWVFDITVRDGKVTHIKEYIDTQALARAASPKR